MFYAGIDIAKAFHVLAVVDEEGETVMKPWTFNNDKAGFAALSERLTSFKPELRLGFEATGHYALNLKLFLEHTECEFMECQPLLVKEFIKSKTMRETTTDQTAAVRIARYLSNLKPYEYRAHPKDFYQLDCLKRLVRTKMTLVHQRSNCLVQITNVMDKTFPEFKPLFGKSGFTVTALYILNEYGTAEKIARLNSQSFDILRRVSRGHFTADKFAELKQRAKDTVGETNKYLQTELSHWLQLYNQLDNHVGELETEIIKIVTELNPAYLSIKGLGPLTAAVIIAEFGTFSRFSNPDKMLAFIGLDCGQHKSGIMQRDGGHMVKHGLTIYARL
jgi:transposase